MGKKGGKKSPATPAVRTRDGVAVALGIGLVGATLLVFSRVFFNDFIAGYDDDQYVLQNPEVRNGLSLRGLAYAATANVAANWHPLTVLSHMLDCTVFGLAPAGHHFTSLAFHAANTLLLFLLLRRMTGSIWRSAAVAALFALHPLHVQSVAHVAQRKDVLSTFFWLLCTLAYVRYAAHQDLRRYLWVVAWFALGLLSKPMLVTLPLVLLLLDYWPLGRMSTHEQVSKPLRKLIVEKVPLFALTLVFSITTFLSQWSSQAVAPLESRPIGLRIENALVAYVAYIGKALWPDQLAAHYPYPTSYPWWETAAAGVALLVVTLLTLKYRRRFPYLLVGWLWYVITLIPVIGLVQVGDQAMADRYTYVPLIGPFIALAWGLGELVAGRPVARKALATAAGFVLAAFAARTWIEVGYWQNSDVVWTRTVEVTGENVVAYTNLGINAAERGDIETALKYHRAAAKISPTSRYYANLGKTLSLAGRYDEAEANYKKALEAAPNDEKARFDLAALYVLRNRIDEAEKMLDAAHSQDAKFHILSGNLLLDAGHLDKASRHFDKALELDPQSAAAWYNYGRLHERAAQPKKALDAYNQALRIDPRLEPARARAAALRAR